MDSGSFRRNANLPNAVTLFRIFMVPVFVVLLFAAGREDSTMHWWAALVFAGAAATDRLDGWLARRNGTVTTFGIVADPIADKALTGSAFVGLSLLDLLPWWITVLVLVREIGVTVLRAVVIRHTGRPGVQGRQAQDRPADHRPDRRRRPALRGPGRGGVGGHGAGRRRHGRHGRAVRREHPRRGPSAPGRCRRSGMTGLGGGSGAGSRDGWGRQAARRTGGSPGTLSAP
jgi:phosphatidylglycerophosphate synthase